MRNFMRLATGIDVAPLALELVRQPELWDQKTYRTTFLGTPHGEISDILLRFSDDSITGPGDPTAAVMADQNAVWYAPVFALPSVKRIVLALMIRTEAYALDRLIITRLAPGDRILPHADDEGEYVANRDRARFHVVVQGLPGSLYRCGSETVQMETGEAWWFDARTEHEVVNNSADDRIHLLVDLRLWPGTRLA